MLFHDTFTKLQAARPRLAAKDHDFADSLIRAYPKWSDKQAHWAGVLAARPDAPPAEEIKVENLDGILGAFAKARTHLKQPNFRVLMGGTAIMRISVASARSRNAGDLYVSNGAAYDDNEYYGRIDQNGVFHPGRDLRGKEAQVRQGLAAFSADPVGAARAYAKLTGKCCFCNTGLEDERSTAVGYGPVCAKRYGLPWTAPEQRAARLAA